MMIIRSGRARMYINSDSSGFNHPAVGPNDPANFASASKKAIEIPVNQGAISGLLTSAVLFLTTAAALTF